MGLPKQSSEDRLVEVVSSESSAVAETGAEWGEVIPTSAPTPAEVVEVIKEPAVEPVAKAAPEPEEDAPSSTGFGSAGR